MPPVAATCRHGFLHACSLATGLSLNYKVFVKILHSHQRIRINARCFHLVRYAPPLRLCRISPRSRNYAYTRELFFILCTRPHRCKVHRVYWVFTFVSCLKSRNLTLKASRLYCKPCRLGHCCSILASICTSLPRLHELEDSYPFDISSSHRIRISRRQIYLLFYQPIVQNISCAARLYNRPLVTGQNQRTDAVSQASFLSAHRSKHPQSI